MSNAAANSFHENFAMDEETGAAAADSSFRENAGHSDASTDPPRVRGRLVVWIVAGAVLLSCAAGLAFGLSNEEGGDEAPAVATSARSPPAVPPDVYGDDGGVKDAEAADFFASDDADGDHRGAEGAHGPSLFSPGASVGDSALLALPEIVATSSPTTSSPSPLPSASPAAIPTDEPSIPPTDAPSASSRPTDGPSAGPSLHPTSSPSASPSGRPTLAPSESPTDGPTKSPTASPSASPSASPTRSPLNFSSWTFAAFGLEPTASPSRMPTSEPSASPSRKPTSEPTEEPTPEPTRRPTPKPTSGPSERPTLAPTNEPSSDPTRKPSRDPTGEPSGDPTREPSSEPTSSPSSSPTDSPSPLPTTGTPTVEPTLSNPYFMGDEFDTYEDLGIEVSRGLSVRVIARTGEPVQFANGDESKLDAHTWPDGAGVVPLNPDDPAEGGYVYVSNSEEDDGKAGVYGIYFDKDGNLYDYRALLQKTTWNCGGGLTPWNTWVSCEEHESGQCWQIDPVNMRAEETVLGGSGGEYESVAVDNRDVDHPVFFITEDDEFGALRRYVADGAGWDALHDDSGDHTFLNMLDDGTFEWTNDEAVAKESASKHYPNSEGISFHEGSVYFMSKEKGSMIILDLEELTYEVEKTGKKFYGEGSFGDEPDQNMFGPTRKYMYFTEDGGDSPGVYARFGNDATYFTLFQAIKGGIYGNDESETTGIALSPDNKRFYAGIQDGIIFEFTRDDGLPFE